MVARAREISERPLGINLLLFSNEELLDCALEAKPEIFSTAWPRDDQDLKAIFARAHDADATVMHMVPTLDDARRAAEAGADVIVAQGGEGGGHVGLIGSIVLVRQVAREVAPVPVLAAGGFADGAGLAAALALGAEGVLLGTRFLAADECPLPRQAKEAIVTSDGHDTIVTTIPDTLSGLDWPGAWSFQMSLFLLQPLYCDNATTATRDPAPCRRSRRSGSPSVCCFNVAKPRVQQWPARLSPRSM
jgi:NAD(P)H-dependent flavin oxidoreductase YrpB (nitropropane dioxygenase family)